MLAWFSITPIGTGQPSVSSEVARAVAAVRALEVRCETDASGTLVEGTWDECTAAIKAASDAVLETAPRVSITAKFDVRTDKPDQAGTDKLASLDRALEECAER